MIVQPRRKAIPASPSCASFLGRWKQAWRAWTRAPSGRPLAENVLELQIIPMTGSQTFLSVKDYYDSGPAAASSSQKSQLPPFVRVTMIVLDENSFSRYQSTQGSTAPTWTDGKLQGGN